MCLILSIIISDVCLSLIVSNRQTLRIKKVSYFILSDRSILGPMKALLRLENEYFRATNS